MLAFYDEVIFGESRLRLDVQRFILADLRNIIDTFRTEIHPFRFSPYIDEDLSVIATLCFILNEGLFEVTHRRLFINSLSSVLLDKDLPDLTIEERLSLERVLKRLFDTLVDRYLKYAPIMRQSDMWQYGGKIAGLHSFYPSVLQETAVH